MIIKTVDQLVREYINNGVEVKSCPDNSYKVLALIEQIKESGDEVAYAKLKYHCDIIDENYFSAIMSSLIKGITIKKEYGGTEITTTTDEVLLNELKIIMANSKAISLGFYYDEKNKLRLNTNKCISYLRNIAEFIIKHSVLMIYNQKEGIFEGLNDELLGTILRYLMNTAISDSWKKVYERDIIDGLMREVPRVDTNVVDDNLIAFNNGVYNITTKELLPHDMKYMFTSKSPIDYKKDADCPIFKRAIKEITCNDDELSFCIQEIFGNALINNTKAERAFFFTGVGSNGKSFCSEVLTEIVGINNVSNIQLSKFSERFGIEGIVSKSLNIANENEIGGAISTENLKAIVSGDRTNISRKYKGSINYKSTCKMIFLLNTLPDTLDNTHGYYRKILIVPFNRVFRSEEMDKNLLEKVSEELSGILNWALEGAEGLISNDYKFTESKAIEKITKAYKADQNPVESFYKEVLIYEEGSSETKKDILDAYKSWVDGQSISSRGTDSPQRFWKGLTNASKININQELEYKKVKGIVHLKNYRIDYSKLPSKEDKYSFI